MPGVVISTAVRTGPSSATVRESSQLFVVGLAERGPSTTATMVESLAEFESIYGGYQSYSYLHPTVETFFEEGGTRCYVARAIGASATVGSLGLDDSSSNLVLSIVANGAGDWSQNVDVAVTQPSPSTFKVNLYFEDNLVYTTGTVSSVAQAAGRINLSSVASRYVVAIPEDGATTIPAVLAQTPLTAGDDDRTSVTNADYITRLSLFNDALGAGAVACPESAATVMTAALVEHANAYNRVAILHGESDATSAEIIEKAGEVSAEDHAEHAALYYPWVEVPTSIAGVSRTIPPDGYVAAKRALAHNQTGAHVPAAGLLTVARFVSGVAGEIDRVLGDTLDEAGVNAIRIIQNTVRIYGARSLSADTDNFRFITQQDTINSIVSDAYRSLEDLVFSTIDGRNTIFSAIQARLVAILAPLRDAGALYAAFDANGRQIDGGFTVKCDSSINPVTQLAEGTVKARVGVRVSSVGDKIEVDIVKSNLTASVV